MQEVAESDSLAPALPLRENGTETGLYYYRARYYDQTAGRFLNEDPLRFRGGADLYSYVRNRATAMRDPSGRFAWGGGVSGSAAAGAFWFGVGFTGSFYFVADTFGNQGILDCSEGGVGAVSVGASAGAGTGGIVCFGCKSICDMQGGMGECQPLLVRL